MAVRAWGTNEIDVMTREFSLAMSLILVASQQTAGQPCRIRAVHIRLGPLAGISRETLLLSYEVATENTPLQGSKLVIQDVPVVLYCPHCQTSRQVAMIQRFCCPECGTPTRDVRQGNELELASLEVETIPPRL